MMALWGARALSFLGTLLTFGITLPVWAFLLIGGWLYWDKTSEVRQAVDKAVTELVAGEELEAERARSQALRQVAEEARRRAAVADEARLILESQLQESEREMETLDADLQRLRDNPVSDTCTVDNILDLLHNR